MDAYYSSFVKRMLASRKAEALGWLRAGAGRGRRTLGELGTTEASVALVERAYALGAVEVLAVEIDDYGDEGQNTGHLLVRLPEEAGAARGRVFAFEREMAEAQGYEGVADEGQEFVYIKLD